MERLIPDRPLVLLCEHGEQQNGRGAPQVRAHCNTTPPVVVSLKQAVPKDEAHPAVTAKTICTAISITDVTPEVKAELCASLDQTSVSVRIKILQPATLKTIDDIFHHISAAARSTIIMLNWTHGLDSLPDPYGQSHAWFSNDGNKWFRYSEVRKIGVLLEEATHSIYAKNVRVDEVVRKVEAGAEEPLARQLFKEAWSQIGINPRSALVVGVSAAEIGLKELIAALIPGTGWLMEEIPTPPVGKVLRKFLPTLQVRAQRADGGPITPPRHIIKQIEDAVEYRNGVVHAGKPPPTRKTCGYAASHKRLSLDVRYLFGRALGSQTYFTRHIEALAIEEQLKGSLSAAKAAETPAARVRGHGAYFTVRGRAKSLI